MTTKTLILSLRILLTIVLFTLAAWLSGVRLELRSLLLVPAFFGLAVAMWANRVNPAGGRIGPAPIPSAPVKTGPYRLFRHPMYAGQFLAVMFFMWYAAGFWAALAIGVVAEILFREYIWREEGSRPPGVNASS